MKCRIVLIFLLSWVSEFSGARPGPHALLAVVHGEVLLNPDFTGAIKLFATPDKATRPRLLRHHKKAEDMIIFEIKGQNDSMFYVSASYAIAGHIADGWVDKSKQIGVYSRVYEKGKSLILYAGPNKGKVVAKIKKYQAALLPVTGCGYGWLKIKLVNKGKTVEGWIPPIEQCANPYTTCN